MSSYYNNSSKGCCLTYVIGFIALIILLPAIGISLENEAVGFFVLIAPGVAYISWALYKDNQKEQKSREHARRMQPYWDEIARKREYEKQEEQERSERERHHQNEQMALRKEIELIGMNAAIKYERSKGGIPKDVSLNNLGYDILSERQYGDRYIEVKARRDEGSIYLTENEWDSAKTRGNNYFVYIVLNAKTYPKLYCIKNPASTISASKNNNQYEIKLEHIYKFTDDVYCC